MSSYLPERFGGYDPDEYEFSSIEEFVESKIDNEESEFNFGEMNCLAHRLSKSTTAIRLELSEWGLTLEHREFEHTHRGFTTSSHDRWYGPGACKTHGGGGGSAIIGMAD
jgi:hypothetical protein